MEPDRFGHFRIGKEGLDGLENVGTKLAPGIPLSEDRFGQALCDKAPVRFLRNLEDQLIHAEDVIACRRFDAIVLTTVLAPIPHDEG